MTHECCLKVLPSYGPNEDGDFPDCDCAACQSVPVMSVADVTPLTDATPLTDDDIPF